MLWTILSIVLLSLVKILMTCLPTGVVNKITNRFAVHQKLNFDHTTITIDGETLEGEEKEKFIERFNAANFLEHRYIFPGTEEAFLHPEDHNNPIVVYTIIANKEIAIFIFNYNDRIEVVKQLPKKVVAYSLFPFEVS